jgi:hypothetical protein
VVTIKVSSHAQFFVFLFFILFLNVSLFFSLFVLCFTCLTRGCQLPMFSIISMMFVGRGIGPGGQLPQFDINDFPALGGGAMGGRGLGPDMGGEKGPDMGYAAPGAQRMRPEFTVQN